VWNFTKLDKRYVSDQAPLKYFAHDFKNFNGLHFLEKGIVFACDHLTGGLTDEGSLAFLDSIFHFFPFLLPSNLPVPRSAFPERFFIPVGEE
jgi:hypothetical protein